MSVDIADIPTVSEFNARTIVSANYALEATLGSPAGASMSADIADIPTVAEFNARTRLDADYFSWATDAVANVTLCATTTTNTN